MKRLMHGVLAAALVLAAASCASTGGSGRTVTDPAGRFSFVAGDELTPRLEREGFYQYRLEKPGIDVYVTAAAAPVEEKGVEDVLDRIGMDRSRLVFDGGTSFGDWQAMRWRLDGGDLNVALAYQARGGVVYALAAAAPREAMPAEPPSAVMHILQTMRFTAAAGSIDRPRTREALEQAIQRAADARSASISVAVIRDGRMVYRFAAGTARRTGPDGAAAAAATTATAYHWGSMTKLVTAVAVMKLVEEGRLSLDAPVERYLPEFPLGLGITARHLLSHSSGLPEAEVDHLISFGGSALPTLTQVLAAYLAGSAGHPFTLVFRPGTDAVYNNWNYLVLGVLVERLSGQSYVDYATGNILRPLGMTHTAFRAVDLPAGSPLAMPVIASAAEPALLAVVDTGRPARDAGALVAGRSGGLTFMEDFDILPPWGGLEGTAEDVARFLGMFMGQAPAGAPPVLKSSTLAAMRTAQRSTAGRTLPWGLGWMLGRESGEDVMEHAGGGAGIAALMRIYPRRGVGVVVMGNVENYGAARILSAAAEIF